jgi:hypothetical protein
MDQPSSAMIERLACMRRRVLGRESGDEVGPQREVGPPARKRYQPQRIGAEWRRFMRLRIRSWPCCSDRWRCGISRGSLAISSCSSGSISTPSSEDRRSRPSAGKAVRIASTSAPSPGSPGRSWPHAGQIDAGQHHFARAASDGAPPRQHRGNGSERLGPAPLRDHAEGAGVVAAVLHCDEGAGVLAGPAGPGATFQARGSSLLALAIRPSTSGIAASACAPLRRRSRLPAPRIGPLAPGAADRLTGLAHGFGRHRAAVDHHQIAFLARQQPRSSSLSDRFSRQPSEMTSAPISRLRRSLDRSAAKAFGGRAGHEFDPFGAPHSICSVAAGQRNSDRCGLPARAALRRRRWRRRRCRRRASHRRRVPTPLSGCGCGSTIVATLTLTARGNSGSCSISGPSRSSSTALAIGHEEYHVRIADIDRDRAFQCHPRRPAG